jgi:Bacterial regulatory protein, Fis family
MARAPLHLIEEKLKECDGNIAAVARAFGVTRSAIWQRIQKAPALKQTVADQREAMKDEVENALYTAAKKGEGWAVCFFLKCQAKDRGYVEKSEAKTPLDAFIGSLPPELGKRLGHALGEYLASGGNPAGGNKGDKGKDAD